MITSQKSARGDQRAKINGRKWSVCPLSFGAVCSFGPVMSPLPPSPLPLSSAALAGLDHHVGKLLHACRAADEVHDGEGLQVLRDAAGGGRGFRVHLVVQGQDLTGQNTSLHQSLTVDHKVQTKHFSFCQSLTVYGYLTCFSHGYLSIIQSECEDSKVKYFSMIS